jgi:hypothetical protein
MIYATGLYYNVCVFEILEHEIRTKMNTNAIKIALFSISLFKFFLSFVASF